MSVNLSLTLLSPSLSHPHPSGPRCLFRPGLSLSLSLSFLPSGPIDSLFLFQHLGPSISTGTKQARPYLPCLLACLPACLPG
ncbi:hypothetical protein LX32DRAFT_180422 [Colletotrichum zoysiae]|uniref:Uncharacterized protein n=1 Tax=Colletotrichum zoysiae TaxID=1216348 RepID=A0AAD9M479_9PEZI|nr:hypothetical protein LX32DRAFT_180422 [Colletotrichum zoysiae]